MGKEDKLISSIRDVTNNLGGFVNIKDVYHCATRMRLTLKDDTLADLTKLKNITLIKGALWSNGELQLIIGQEVSKITSFLKTEWKAWQQDSATDAKDFDTKNMVKAKNVSIWKRLLKSISAIFGPLIPFLIGVGLIMAIQQLLFRAGAIKIPGDGEILGTDYNLFDYIFNVIAGTGFKIMGVIAMWSTVRYLGGKTPTALAVALIMISPILVPEGILMFSIGNWEVSIAPYHSTMLVFIVMGVLIAYSQKTLEKYLHPIANFILNPLITILCGGLLAFFVMGPIMGVIENAMLVAFNWFMKLPLGIGTMIVGLTWQPLVVLGVHNILFFAAVTAIEQESSLFLAAAFAAAWAQMGATIGVALKSKKNIDKYGAVAAAIPGIISGPTESCIYAVNLPKGLPFITGVIAGGIGGWLIGIFSVDLDNLAGLGGIVGFLAYTDDLLAAILIDLTAFALGIGITYAFWSEDKSEKVLALKTLKLLNKNEFLTGKNDFQAHKARILIKKLLKSKNKEDLKQIETELIKLKKNLIKLEPKAENLLDHILKNYSNSNLDKNIIRETSRILKNISTDSQVKANSLYQELKIEIKNLKEISPNSKEYSKLIAKKENAEFALKKLQTLKLEKSTKLINKGDLMLSSNDAVKVEKGSRLIEFANNNNWKEEKIKILESKITQYNFQIDESHKKLSSKIDVLYSSIVNKVSEIQNHINEDLTSYKDKLYNDLHDKEINSGKIIARIV